MVKPLAEQSVIMAKTVDDITRALKLKATPKNNALTFKLGVKKHTLPFEVRYLASNDYVFVHIPPAAAVMKVTPNGLVAVDSVDEASQATSTFRQSKKKQTKRASKTQLPSEVAEALRRIPAGYKIAYGADGSPRMVKMRKRSK